MCKLHKLNKNREHFVVNTERDGEQQQDMFVEVTLYCTA